ncbi:MAG: hypothetical protein FD143_3646, partial [Ignavibacteria bacterium]
MFYQGKTRSASTKRTSSTSTAGEFHHRWGGDAYEISRRGTEPIEEVASTCKS